MIADKIRFYTGVAMLALFSVVLIIMFSPVFDGKNGMEYTDELYNSISKGSAYYIPDVRERSAEYIGTTIDVTIKMESEEQAEQTALLYQEAGAEASLSGVEVQIAGDLRGLPAGPQREAVVSAHEGTDHHPVFGDAVAALVVEELFGQHDPQPQVRVIPQLPVVDLDSRGERYLMLPDIAGEFYIHERRLGQVISERPSVCSESASGGHSAASSDR